MTDLTFTILKYAFLILLWVFVFFVVKSLGRDVGVFSPRSSRKRRQRTNQAQQTVAAPPAPQPRSAGSVESRRSSAVRSQPAATVLVVIDGPLAGTTVSLSSRPITLGRAPDNAIILDDEFVSAHHARVFYDPSSGNWAVEDMNSTNGTVVNGQRIHGAVMLPTGVPVRIGATTFELR